MKTCDFDLYLHIRGSVETEDDSDDALLEAIFSNNYCVEIDDITEYPTFCSKGYRNYTVDDEDNED